MNRMCITYGRKVSQWRQFDVLLGSCICYFDTLHLALHLYRPCLPFPLKQYSLMASFSTIMQEWFRNGLKNNKFKLLTCPPKSSDLNLKDVLQTKPTTSNRLKASAINVLTDTPSHRRTQCALLLYLHFTALILSIYCTPSEETAVEKIEKVVITINTHIPSLFTPKMQMRKG